MHTYWSDVNLASATVRVSHKPDRGWTPKAYKEREIPIPNKLVAKRGKRPERIGIAVSYSRLRAVTPSSISLTARRPSPSGPSSKRRISGFTNFGRRSQPGAFGRALICAPFSRISDTQI